MYPVESRSIYACLARHNVGPPRTLRAYGCLRVECQVLMVVLRKLGFGAAGSANLQHLPGYPNSQARFSPDSLQICRRKIFTDSHSFLQNFVVNQEYGVN